jgi:hypothetical protein
MAHGAFDGEHDLDLANEADDLDLIAHFAPRRLPEATLPRLQHTAEQPERNGGHGLSHGLKSQQRPLSSSQSVPVAPQ